MALRRQEERVRKAALHRLDNEECGVEEEEEEEEEMTDDSEAEVCVSRASRGKPFHRLRLTQCNIILFTLLFRISTSLLVGNIGFTMN